MYAILPCHHIYTITPMYWRCMSNFRIFINGDLLIEVALLASQVPQPTCSKSGGTLSKYWLISYYHLCHFCQPMKVRERWAAHSLLRQMQSIELNKLTKKNSDVLFAEKWKWKSWTISGVKKNKKQKTKLLLRQLQSIELNKLPRKTATCCVRKACEGNVSTVTDDVLYARILG